MAGLEGLNVAVAPELEVRPTGNLLEVDDLHVSFAADGGDIEALRGVSFVARPGRTVALVGESGSGKSVCAQAILGILPDSARITGGAILYDDRAQPGRMLDLAQLPQNNPERRRIRGGDISIVFQEPMTSLSPVHTIGNQIGEALSLHRDVEPGAVKDQVVHMLARVGFPNPERSYASYPFELSGGLRQRAMIAMALICHPALLIADEPTTALDVTIQAQILKLMKDLQAELGMAILFITHDLGVVANMADDVVVMYHGRVMEAGPCEALLRQPRHPYLKALLHAVPRLTTPIDQRLTPLREIPDAGESLMGREPAPDNVATLPGGRLLALAGLNKSFTLRKQGLFGSSKRVVQAVTDVGFTLKRGESFALVGESGCGKTTVSKIVMRAVDPDEGEVRYFGGEGEVDVLALKGEALRKFRRRIQYIFQDPFSSLNPRMTVLDILTEPLVIHGIGTEAERLARAKALLEGVGLDVRHLRRYPHSFSGGQRQRIGIARALALGPEILICDEPVSALDVSVQAQILNLLKDLQARLNLTYLFISHNLAVVRYVAQRIAVMCAGRIVELADTAALFDNPVHPYTRGLLAAVPEPDPERPLDLRHLMSERQSDPAAWPEPFDDAHASARLVELGRGHFVRMNPAEGRSELRGVL